MDSIHYQRPAPRSWKSPGPEDGDGPLSEGDILTTASQEIPAQPQSTTLTSGVLNVTYNRLDPSQKEIRVLELESFDHTPSDDVVCEMSTISLVETEGGKSHPYIAVSYAWEDLQFTDEITINGRKVRIPRSLYGALKAIRDAAWSRVAVWADYLCVNQCDIEERSSQVGLMDVIYQKAFSVAIWLGPEPRGPECDKLADEIMAVESFSLPTDPTSLDWLDQWSKKDRFTLDKLLLMLALLFSRSYFQRLWVATEIFNARHICVYFGNRRVPWEILQRISSAFQSTAGRQLLDQHLPISHPIPGTRLDDSLSDEVDLDFLSPNQILKYHGPASFGRILANKGVETVGYAELLGYLQICRTKRARNPHDRIFALRGLLPQSMRAKIRVDYSSQVKDVYIATVTEIILRTRRIDVIREAVHFPPHPNNEGLPSWVVDLHHNTWVPSLRSNLPGHDFQADRGRPRAAFVFPENSFKRRIHIKAITLGKIKTIGIAVNAIGRLGDYLAAFTNWRALYLHHMKTPGTGTMRDSHDAMQTQEVGDFEFCETLMFNERIKAARDEAVATRERRKTRDKCYTLFASLFKHRLPEQPLDEHLQSFATLTLEQCTERRQYFQDRIAENMLGRCFCITSDGKMGLGSGYMNPRDVVVVPYGCATPIILRPCRIKGDAGERLYQYVGDVYIHGYMYGKAVEEEKAKKRQAEWYLIQ